MRPGQKNRMRGGRGNNGSRRGPNPLTRSYESNGPDVKVRGTPQHIAEKYVQLARDAHSSGDTVMAESYLQHAEHYYRIISAAQNAQQQAWNQANGIPTPEADQAEDEDEFEVQGADRFTFRTPQSFQPQQGGPGFNGPAGFQQQPFQQPQSYNGDPGAGDQPPMPEGQPVAGEGGQQPYQQAQQQQQQNRGDRQFGNRRFDRRFGRDRGERNFGDRQGGERNPADRPQGERPPLPPRAGEGGESGREEGGLPSFITAPSRAPFVEAPAQDDAAEGQGGEGGIRRRRRRSRGGSEATPEAGGEE